MPELQAQRTLVKSPPELWAELSDPAALARHLNDFGEIRITRVVPEQTVAWEGERASGTVELSESGWGTKVTLRARLTDESPAPPPPERPSPERPSDPFALLNSISRAPLLPPAQPKTEPETEPEPDAREEPTVSEAPANEPPPEPPAPAAPSSEAAERREWFTSAPEAESEPGSVTHDVVRAGPTAQRPRLFARLFGSRTRVAATGAQGPAAAVDPTPLLDPMPETESNPDPDPYPMPEPEPMRAPEPVPDPEPEPDPEPDPDPQPEPEPMPPPAPIPTPEPDPPLPAATHPAADDFDPARAEAVLTAVLDELGTARHRPFSRG